MNTRGRVAFPSPAMLTDDEFESFIRFFYDRTGIVYGSPKRDFVTKRILSRMAATGCGSFRSYFGQLRFDEKSGEIQELINLLVINETYFFREEHQFEVMTSDILPEIVATAKTDRNIRIWSMPCSTGEEVYSIAISLLDRWPDLSRYDVEIVGTDISTSVLRFAERGLYGSRAVQKLSDIQLHRYFISHPGKQYEILPYIRESVRFEQANVLNNQEIGCLKPFDIIFCRNMLIYFDTEKQAAAVANLFEMLRPGGFLFLGHSESMSRMSQAFIPRRFLGNFVYQKPGGDHVPGQKPRRLDK